MWRSSMKMNKQIVIWKMGREWRRQVGKWEDAPEYVRTL
jgi:hypothetical protein